MWLTWCIYYINYIIYIIIFITYIYYCYSSAFIYILFCHCCQQHIVQEMYESCEHN